MVHRVVKRARTAWPEFRCFHETALLTAVGVGIHALVDNCWTIPVTASSLVVLALADPLPLRSAIIDRTCSRWSKPQLAFVALATAAVYILSTAIPGLGLFYNDRGHKAYDREDYATAQKYHLAAVAVVPDHPIFLDNLGMVYFQQFTENGDPKLLPPAKEYFRRALKAAPRWIEPHIHMEALLTRSMTGDASKDFDIHLEIIQTDAALLEIDPYIPFVRKNLAGAYYSTGQFDQAFLELRKAIEYEPNYVPGHLQMASWYEERGDEAASRRHTAAAMSIISKYRLFKPTEPYEGLLLGRPRESWIQLTTKR
jgi:tetratricopeptide (TPR) repeat protein